MSRARPWVQALAGVVLVIALVACDALGASPAPSPPQDSGIQGNVQLGPTCPVESRDVPCVTPYAALLIILDADSREVGRVMSAADGTFRVPLAAGQYTIAPAAGGDPYPFAPTQAVAVVPGRFTDVQINYDSGIR